MSLPAENWSYFDFEDGALVEEWEDPAFGIKGQIRKGPFSFCAYVGVPRDSPAAGLEELDLPVHGGVTFTSEGDGGNWAEGYYWYGWDYAHCNDLTSLSYTRVGRQLAALNTGELRVWTVSDIREEVLTAIAWLNRHLAEVGRNAPNLP